MSASMNLLNIRKIGYGVRSIDELRHPNQAAQVPVCQAHQTHQPQTSIFDDTRFNNYALTPVHAENAAADLYAQGDNRFAASATSTTAPAASQSQITEENVERIIKEVLGRLTQ